VGRQLGYWMETDKGYGRQAETDQQRSSENCTNFSSPRDRADTDDEAEPEPWIKSKIFGARPTRPNTNSPAGDSHRETKRDGLSNSFH